MTTLLAYIALLLPSYEVKETVYRTASVYSDSLIGNKTANGERFNQDGMTAATREWPFGTWLKLTHPNGNTCFVRVNDRNETWLKGKWIDLARKPWLMLEEKSDGLHHGVKVEVVVWQ